jgi:hypothetical protein
MFEPRAGEHIYDRAVDGSECRWARILAYEPPARGSARVLGVGLEAVLATLGSSPDMLRLAAKERLRQAG